MCRSCIDKSVGTITMSMRNLHQKNITSEACKPAQVTCAKDWVMEYVTLLTPSGDSIALDRASSEKSWSSDFGQASHVLAMFKSGCV